MTPRRGGLFVSLRRLAGTALEIAHVRLQLLLTELEQEKLRLFDALLWAGVALLALGIGTLLLCGFIVMLFVEGHRLAVLGVLTLLFVGGGLWSLHAARERLRSPGSLLRASIDEIAHDREALSPAGAGGPAAADRP